MKKISRRSFLRVSAMAGAGVMLAACGGGEATPEVAPTEPAEVEATVAPTAVPEADEPTAEPMADQPWPREDVPRERTLVFSNGGPEYGYVGNGNPYARTHQHGQSATYENLWIYTPTNDKLYPWLAESYEYNDDASELTVYLRKGAKWFDGVEFTAHDVVYTVEMLKEYAPLLSFSAQMKNTVENVEALDDYTVKFTFVEPTWRFHFDLLNYKCGKGIHLVPEHVWSEQDLGEDPREFMFYDVEKMWPLHTGPYAQTRLDIQVQHYDLRYEWWAVDVGLVDAMPEPLRIEVIPYPGDEVGAQLIINDEIDVCLDVRPATMESILAQGGDHVVSYTGNEKPYGYVDWWPTSIWFNTLEKPYDDPRVRWAMAYAINQQTMIDVGLDGAGEVTGHPFPKYPGLMRYVEGAQDILDEYNVLEHNQEKVDELMTEAGYSRNEDGYWADENGDPLNADLYAAVPLFADIAPILVEMMRQAGFDANHMAPPDVWTAKTNGTALIHLFGHGGSLRDPFVTLDMYHSRWQKPTGENCGLNRARWANEEYDAIVEEIARLPMDEYDKIQELFNDAMRIWYRELPDLPLQQWYHRVPWNTTYWTGWPNEDDPYNNAPWQRSFIITLTRIKAAQA